MKAQFFAAAFVAVTLAASAGSTNDVLEAESDIEMPKIKASIDFYDYFTEAQRKTYDKFDGFIAVAGCRLAFEF